MAILVIISYIKCIYLFVDETSHVPAIATPSPVGNFCTHDTISSFVFTGSKYGGVHDTFVDLRPCKYHGRFLGSYSPTHE